MHKEVIYANALNLIPELGPSRLSELHAYFESYESAWRAPARDLGVVLRTHKLVRVYTTKRSIIEPEKEYARIQSLHITITLKGDASYPQQFLRMLTPPPLIYSEGTLTNLAQQTLGVVGTRTPTAYGKEVCDSLIRPLAKAHVPIISGLASGIDTVAHRACLAENGYTVAVLGSGLARNVLYPSSNKRLADEIIAGGGAVVSEYPPYMKAAQWTFPQRNRIIAGLSSAVLVVEARQKSGTRITAGYALEYGRDVLAVPGSIFSTTSQTPHDLIKDGATPVTSADDIFEALGIPQPSFSPATANLLAEEEFILSCLYEPITANTIARKYTKDISTVQHILALLEIRGMVKNMGNGIYRKT
jgi:DNA processing protein